MRILPFFLGVLLSLGCHTTQKVTSGNKLNGVWIPIHEEIGGQQLPEVAFKTQKLVISDSNYTFTAESIDKGVITWSGNKMDIFGREGVNKGKHFTAIYKIENNELVICYNLKGDSYPEAFATSGKPTLFLSTFKKE